MFYGFENQGEPKRPWTYLFWRPWVKEVSTRHDMNYGQVWYPTLVDKLINFTKAEPLFGT